MVCWTSFPSCSWLRYVLQGMPHLDVRIKWPNDLYLGGLKVGGILSTSVYRSKKFYVSAGKLSHSLTWKKEKRKYCHWCSLYFLILFEIKNRLFPLIYRLCMLLPADGVSDVANLINLVSQQIFLLLHSWLT